MLTDRLNEIYSKMLIEIFIKILKKFIIIECILMNRNINWNNDEILNKIWI